MGSIFSNDSSRKISQLQQSLNSLRQELNNLQLQRNNYISYLQNAQKQRNQKQEQIKQLLQKIQWNNKQIQIISQKYNDVSSNLSDMKKKISSKQNQIFRLTQSLKLSKMKQSQLNQSLKQSKMKQSQLNYSLRQQKSKLQVLTKDYNKAATELRSLKDPKKIKENQQKMFLVFLDSLTTFNIYNPMPKQGNIKYVTVMGETSAGKSSIYNWLFNLGLETGQGEVTMDIQKVFIEKQTKRVFWDCPGLNEEIEIVDHKLLQAFYGIDCLFIATDRTFKFSKRAIQVMNKINPPQLFMLRTKCDLFKSDQQLEQILAKDRKYLQSLGVHRKILCISTLMPDDYKDNKRFKQLMLGK